MAFACYLFDGRFDLRLFSLWLIVWITWRIVVQEMAARMGVATGK